MAQKKLISCKDITLLYELVDEIRKYQGISGSSQSLFGIEDDFTERIEVDSLNITRQPNWIIVTGKTHDYDFEIHKFENILKIEKRSKERDVNIIKFVDNDFNVRTNSTMTNYKVNNPLSKTKNIRGKGNATLLCDYDGNFIYEEQFWQIHEGLDSNEPFMPYVRHQILQAIGNDFVLEKNQTTYYEETVPPKNNYRKNVIRKVSDSKKVIAACGIIDEATYYKLLEESSSLKTDETRNPKQKLKDRIFKRKA